MGRISKSERVGLWLERLNRLAESGMTVAEFCQAEGISVPSLYQWKRRLSPRVDGPIEDIADLPEVGGHFAELVVASASETGAAVMLPRNIRIQLEDAGKAVTPKVWVWLVCRLR